MILLIGKLVKNINVTVDSPFEKYLKSVDIDSEDAEILASSLVLKSSKQGLILKK